MTNEGIDDLVGTIEADYHDARSALIVIAESLIGLGDTTALSQQQEILLDQALDACFGALHYIGCDDVVFELSDSGTVTRHTLTDEEAQEWRREKDRARKRKQRELRGAKPHRFSAQRLRPWETQGISRATYYRRQRETDNRV